MTVEFRLLGPVEALVDGSPVALGGRKPRAVLAMLLLNRGAVVSADRLVDGLWGESPPEGAANAVQAYVSRLRAALHDRASDANGTQMLVTRAPGYLLRVDADQVDLGRFETLVARTRDGATNGDRRHTRSLLVEAEGLWRGDALAEFADEPFALLDAPRLAEMRLAATEERLALDLELGRQADAVGELERLAVLHPYRERITELLMLALYRCGRQAEALAAYQRLRTTLVDETGLEPGHAVRSLQRAILEQEPSLAASPTVAEPTPPAGTAGTSARVRRRWAGALAAVVAAIVAVVVAALSGGGRSPPSLPAGSIAVLDARTGSVLDDLPVRGSIGSEVVFRGGLWVADPQTDTLKRIDLQRGTVRTVGLGVPPTSVAAADGLIWVGSASGRSLLRFDPQLWTLRRPIPIKADVGVIGTPAAALAAGTDALWVDTGGSGGVWRIDPATGRVTAKVTGVETGTLTADRKAVWVVGDFFSSGRVDRIDARSAHRSGSIPLPGGAVVGIATGAGAVWVATSDGTVCRIDPDRNALVRTISAGKGLSGIAVADGSVWVTNAMTGVAVRIDPGTDSIVDRVPLGQSATAVATANGRLYVTLARPAPAPPDTAGIHVVLNSGIDSIDPAVSFWASMWEIEYTTGRPLLNYPDRAGPAGTRLVPDAALRMPTLSADRRTYTFRLRRGMRFSSGASITAESFRYAIERALAPAMGSLAGDFLGDVVGAQSYVKGRAPHIVGIRSPDARTISFTLVRPDPSFLARIAMPFFTPVPVGTRARPATTHPIASAGPYMLSEYRPHQVLVLRRNPYYDGPRPQVAGTIEYRLDTREPGPRLVIENRADYLADPLSAEDASRLLKTGSRVLVAPYLTVDYLALNTRRPPLDRPGMRRALALAVNRAALARTLGVRQASVTDQYLPPAVPGYRGNGLAYDLFHGDVARARHELRAAGVTKPLRLTLLTCDDPACAARAEVLGGELRPLGVKLRVRAVARDREFALDTARSATFDIADEGFVFPFLDPGAGVFAFTDQARFDLPASFAEANDLSPAARDQALGRMLERIARDHAPVIGYAVSNTVTLGSRSLGCVVAQPVYGVDLTRLCVRH